MDWGHQLDLCGLSDSRDCSEHIVCSVVLWEIAWAIGDFWKTCGLSFLVRLCWGGGCLVLEGFGLIVCLFF